MKEKIRLRGRTTNCNLNIGSSVKPDYELEFELTPSELYAQLKEQGYYFNCPPTQSVRFVSQSSKILDYIQ